MRKESCDTAQKSPIRPKSIRRRPSKDGLVIRLLDDLQLQSQKRFVPFTVEERRVNTEKTHQRVSSVLSPGSAPSSGPAHASCNSVAT